MNSRDAEVDLLTNLMKGVFGLWGRVSVNGLGNQVFSGKRLFFLCFQRNQRKHIFLPFSMKCQIWPNPDGYKTWFLAVFTRTLKNGKIDFSIFQRFRENPFFSKF